MVGPQQIHRRNVEDQSEEVGHEAMAAEAVHVQAVFQFIHAMFAFTALDVIVVLALAVFGGADAGAIGDDEALVGPAVVALGFGDDRPGEGP